MTTPLLQMTYDRFKEAHSQKADASEILCWGRAWMVTLTLWVNRNGVDPGGPTLTEMVHYSMIADLDDILEAISTWEMNSPYVNPSIAIFLDRDTESRR